MIRGASEAMPWSPPRGRGEFLDPLRIAAVALAGSTCTTTPVGFRDWMAQVAFDGGYAYATNGHLLVRICLGDRRKSWDGMALTPDVCRLLLSAVGRCGRVPVRMFSRGIEVRDVIYRLRKARESDWGDDHPKTLPGMVEGLLGGAMGEESKRGYGPAIVPINPEYLGKVGAISQLLSGGARGLLLTQAASEADPNLSPVFVRAQSLPDSEFVAAVMPMRANLDVWSRGGIEGQGKAKTRRWNW